MISDIPAITKIAAEFEIPVHSDAVAAFGHVPIDFQASGLTAMTLVWSQGRSTNRRGSACGC